MPGLFAGLRKGGPTRGPRAHWGSGVRPPRCGAGGFANKASAVCGRLPPDVVAIAPALLRRRAVDRRHAPNQAGRRDPLEHAPDGPRARGQQNHDSTGLQDHVLKPHLTKSFKLSRYPKFVEKLIDVVGVYLTPPQNAVVRCVDEESQIQALDRTQPGLPLKPGRCGT